MAVFKQELNWSSYQDRQLDILKSISKSLDNNLMTSKDLYSTMSKIEYSMTAIAKELVSDVAKFNEGFREVNRSASIFSNRLEDTSKKAEGFGNKLEVAGDQFTSVISKLDKGVSLVFGSWKQLAENANNFSTMSNQMIKLSGMNGASVREFRSELMSIVSDLNASTGGAINPSRSYEAIISMSQGVTSNLESIEEMSRPLLLAYESLDININSVAKLFNRFYTRYSFSSTAMEESLNEIRGNTAGNSASAEATMANINALEAWINDYARNDNELRTELLGKISHYTSWLESMELDSNKFTDYLNIAAYGDWTNNPELVNILSRSGISATQATDMARTGQYEELTQSIMKGIYDIISNTKDSYALGTALDNYNIDRDLAMEVWNTVNSLGYKGLDEFMESVDNTSTMEDLVDDKYVSLGERITNQWLEKIYEKVAKLQEFTGIGLSDLVAGAIIGKSLIGSFPTFGRGTATAGARGLFGGSPYLGLQRAQFGNNLSGGALMGSQAATLGAAGLGGLGLGLGVGAYGIYSGINDIRSGATGYGIANLAGGTAGLVGAGALGAGLLGVGGANFWNPVGWGALLAGGVTVLGTNLHKAATTIGTADSIESAYIDAANKIRSQANQQENALLEIKANLNKNQDLEKVRQDLINTGILSESDIEKARNANRQGLEKLTSQYVTATGIWSAETQKIINESKKEDIAYASGLQGGLNKTLQNWNDSGQLKAGSDELAAVENLFFELYQSLEGRVASGEELDSSTEKIYKRMIKAFKDGTLSTKEANSIIDAGLFNTLFKNSNYGIENIIKAGEIFAATNSTAYDAYANITKELGEYAGVDEATRDVKNISDYVPQYAEGSNYINKDQLAILHEGEAVIPKKYNPSANENMIGDSIEYLAEFVEELKEIRIFLAEWKESSAKQERLSEIRSRHRASSALVSQYFPDMY